MEVGDILYCRKTGYFNSNVEEGNEFAIKGKMYPIVQVEYDDDIPNLIYRIKIIDEDGREHGWKVGTEKFRNHFMKPLIPRKIKKHKL